MKKILFVGVLLMSLAAVQATAQCEEAYSLCMKQLSKEEKKEGWNVNKQSQGISFEKGSIYETDLTAYKGLEYRLSVCSDIAGGTDAKFQLVQELMVTVTDSLGNASIQRQRKVIFDNTTDNPELYVLFRSNKTEKFYLSVSVPADGESKKLKNTENVCVGVLLEHRKTTNSAF